MKVHPPKIIGYILLVKKMLVWWHRLIKGSSVDLLPSSMSSSLLESKSHQRHRRFGTKQVVFQSTIMARVYSPGDEKIDFVGVM